MATVYKEPRKPFLWRSVAAPLLHRSSSSSPSSSANIMFVSIAVNSGGCVQYSSPTHKNLNCMHMHMRKLARPCASSTLNYSARAKALYTRALASSPTTKWQVVCFVSLKIRSLSLLLPVPRVVPLRAPVQPPGEGPTPEMVPGLHPEREEEDPERTGHHHPREEVQDV